MCNYYLKIKVGIKLFLMGKMLIHKKIYVPIPPIEKGVDMTAESVTKEIYDCIQGIPNSCIPHVEDLRLELTMEGSSITTHYEMQLVNKREVYFPDLSNFNERIRYCMVMVERELVKKLADISNHLYD